jgi:hypothetical protein
MEPPPKKHTSRILFPHVAAAATAGFAKEICGSTLAYLVYLENDSNLENGYVTLKMGM